jgi:cytidylate kinase
LADEAALAALVEPGSVALRRGTEAEIVLLDGEDVTREIRTPRVTNEVHWLARAPAVRARITEIVRELARGRDVVAEGRDTTTAIFPEADVKFYIDATPEERARRRGLELEARGMSIAREALFAQIRERDERDKSRAAGPLLRAPDAVYVDTTGLLPEEVIERLMAELRRRAVRPSGP